MACGITLKRPFTSLPVDSPTEPVLPLAKRRCGFDVARSPSRPCQPLELQLFSLGECSPLKSVPPISREQLIADFDGEVKKMRRRRRYFESTGTRNENKPPSAALTPSKCPGTPSSQSPCASLPGTPRRPADQPMFTTNQVVFFCERKLKEREDELREVFDKILNKQLTEQYDSFVRFTEEQNRKKFSDTECSYVS